MNGAVRASQHTSWAERGMNVPLHKKSWVKTGFLFMIYSKDWVVRFCCVVYTGAKKKTCATQDGVKIRSHFTV